MVEIKGKKEVKYDMNKYENCSSLPFTNRSFRIKLHWEQLKERKKSNIFQTVLLIHWIAVIL
jgi:hypothetical protein